MHSYMVSGLIKQLWQRALDVVSNFLPTETLQVSKEKWNRLAKENARYYVVSRVGKGITEIEFRKFGIDNYTNLITSDSILKEKLGGLSDKVVLDVGCGIGRLEEFFASDVKEVYGIDISENMVALGKERLKNFKNAHLYSTDGIHYPFKDNFFDFVFSYLVFQHMPSQKIIEANFREIYRVLKSTGIAKIQVRGGHQPYKWQWFYGKAFTRKQIYTMLQSIGFNILKDEGEGVKRFWLWLGK